MPQTTTAAKRSLMAFAKINPSRKRVPCWFCSLPEINEINEGKRNGFSATTIKRWLVEDCGYDPADITEYRLSVHFYKGGGHVEPPAPIDNKPVVKKTQGR